MITFLSYKYSNRCAAEAGSLSRTDRSGSRQKGKVAVLAFLMACGVSGGIAAASPLSGYDGTWNGSGYVAMSNGAREAIRCVARYTSDGSASLQASISCASDSYKIQIGSRLKVSADGALSGSWDEATRQVTGELSGHISNSGLIQARLGGTPYDIQAGINTSGRAQAISIYVNGSDVQSVMVRMHKR